MFITFEGPDGSGKTTHVRLLARFLRAHGVDPIVTHEPGGTALGDHLLGPFLKGRIPTRGRVRRDLDPRAEVLLYMASRAQLMAEVVEPALRGGRVVVCDRFLDSSLAYQGAAGGLGVARVRTLGAAWAIGTRWPDLTVLLDLDPREGLRRAREGRGQRPDRIESRELAFHRHVRAAYRRLAREEPRRFRVIPTTADRAQDQERIRAAVVDVLRRVGRWS